MERVMNEAPLATIQRINARFALLLQDARSSLRGGREFGPEKVRQFRATLAEMVPIVAQSGELRRTHAEAASLLDAYKSQLRELQELLVQIRVVMQTRQAKLNASKSHTAAVSSWVSAFHLTC
jgi:hypothetical protein